MIHDQRLVLPLSQGLMRAADETEVIQSGFIWDNLPLVEKEMDAIDFTRLRHAVKINKFPGLRHLNRYMKNICTCIAGHH
jgi:hypothetical protein